MESHNHSHRRLMDMTDRELLILVVDNIETMLTSIKDHETRLRSQEDKTLQREAREQAAEKNYTRNISIGMLAAALLGGLGDRIAHLVAMVWALGGNKTP